MLDSPSPSPVPMRLPPDGQAWKHSGSGLGSSVSGRSEGRCVGQEAAIDVL